MSVRELSRAADVPDDPRVAYPRPRNSFFNQRVALFLIKTLIHVFIDGSAVHFRFPLSVPFHQCSTLSCQYHSTSAPLSPVSIIPLMLHSPLSVSFHRCSTLPCQYHSTSAPLSPVSIIPPMLHSPLSVSFHQCSTLPCQYHSTRAPYSSPSICYSSQMDKLAKPGNPPKKQRIFGI